MSDRDYNKSDEFDPTIAHLAKHMQTLRESVPVNYELKQSLKKRLLEQMRKQNMASKHKTTAVKRRKQIGWFISLGTVLVLFIIVMFCMDSKLGVAEWTELGSYPVQAIRSQQPVSVSADGEYVVMEHDGALLLLSKDGKSTRITGGEDRGVFLSPSWSNEKQWFAAVYEEEGKSEVWLLQQYLDSAVSRLIYREEGVTFSSLHWSADDQWIKLLQKTSDSRSTATGETIQISTDGNEVQRSDMMIDSEELEDRQELATVRWPKKLEKKLDRADEVWFDWNGDHSALALVTRYNEDIEVFLLKLRNKKRPQENPN